MWDAAEENVRSDRMRSQQTWKNDVRGTILQSSANVQNQAPPGLSLLPFNPLPFKGSGDTKANSFLSSFRRRQSHRPWALKTVLTTL